MVDTSVVIIRCNPDLPDPHHGVEVREESVRKVGMVEGQPYKRICWLGLYGILGPAQERVLTGCMEHGPTFWSDIKGAYNMQQLDYFNM